MTEQREVVSELPEKGGRTEPSDRGDGRNERGQFASKGGNEVEPQPGHQGDQQQQQEPRQAPPEGFIPIQAFDARMAKAEEKWSGEVTSLRGQLSDALRQLQQFQHQQRPQQAPAPKPDFFDNPEAAFDARVSEAIKPIAQGQTEIVHNFSRMMAIDKFDEAAVTAGEDAIKARIDADPRGMYATYQSIMQSAHPYGALLKWHKEQSALTTYGNDPEGYIKAEVERRLAAMQQQGGQQQQQTPPSAPPAMPRSFASAPNNGPRSNPGFGGPKPLSEIMGGR